MLYSKRKWMVIFFVLPFLAFAGVFLFYPFAQNIINMFYQFDNMSDWSPTFVAFENFPKLFSDQYFSVSLRNTALLLVGVIVFQMGIALILALLVNGLKKFQNVYRILFFVPIVISASALGTMLFMFSDKDTGLFNQLLAMLGVEHGNWLPQSNWFAALCYVMMPVIWQYIGFYFVIMLTGLANISEDIMEASKIDGASGLKATFYITLPMLWNVFRTCMVLAITGALKVFDIPHILAPSGSPVGQTFFMGTFNSYLFNAENGTRAGECAIYAVLMVVVGIVVSQLSNAVIRENKDI